MSVASLTSVAAVLAMLTAFGVAGAVHHQGGQSSAGLDALHLVAMMRCGTEDDGEMGAGIVFAVADERIYLATAHHVVQACRQKPEIFASSSGGRSANGSARATCCAPMPVSTSPS